MGLAQAPSQQIAINQASTTNAATASGYVDTLGSDFCTIDVITTTSNNTTNNPSVLKITEGDTTVISSASAIAIFEGDNTTSGWTIPAAVTSGDWGVKYNIDLRGRKRYLFVSVSPVTTQTITAIGNLLSNEEAAINTTRANVKALIEG